jgi:two-component system invasion response regulator UvrY
MHQVFIVDDHAVVRHGIRRLLEMTPDMQVAGEASSGAGMVDMLTQSVPDLLLLDMNMPGTHGAELISEIHHKLPALPILVLSIYDDIQLASAALNAGARGYLTKDSEPEMIIDAIRQCIAGKGYIHPALGARLLSSRTAHKDTVRHEILSPREQQIFMMLVRGSGINDISEKLHISPKTVSTHKFRILQKMALKTVSELVRYAIRHSLIEA